MGYWLFLPPLARHLQLHGDPVQIAEGWNSIFIDEITETRRVVEAARAKLPCHAVTITPATHPAAWPTKFPAVVGAFDGIFVSPEIGHRKPERSAFEFVARSVGVPVESILFFDGTRGERGRCAGGGT